MDLIRFFIKVSKKFNRFMVVHLFTSSFLSLCFSVQSQVIDVSQPQHHLSVEVAMQTINGYLFLPNDITKPIDIIIAVHGSGGLVSDCGDINEIPEFKSQFRFWRDEVPNTGRAIFFVESFCNRGVNSFQSKTPPEDESLSPYQIRAEDVKQSARLLKDLKFIDDEGIENDLIDDQVWIGWSHGAGAVIAAGYKVPENTDNLVFDVSSSGNEFVYGPPLSESFSDVKGIMAWYGGYNFFGYFKDGSDIFYEPIDGISIVTHCGSNDDICFKDSNEQFIRKMIDEGRDVTRYIYQDVNHSFDNAKDNDSMEDQAARDLARERAFNFFDEMFNEDETVLGVEKINIVYYPNPTFGYLKLESTTNDSFTYQIISSEEKVVKVGSFTGTTEINSNTLEEGIYLVKVIGANEKVFRIIKM